MMIRKRPFVPLESLVGLEDLTKADAFNLDDFKYTTSIRGKKLDWLCPSRRLLWMACGHEHIEPELLDWIDAIPRGEVLFDIGASNGIFSMYAAASALRVVAIEPDPLNYFLLAYNSYLNSKSHGVTLEGCYNLAISSSTATGHMQIKRWELGGHEKILDKSTDVFGNAFQPEYSHPVLTCTLDALTGMMGLPQPKYLKIDVDGSEVQVLKGAETCLKGVTSLFVELKSETMHSSDVSILDAHGFTLKRKYQVQNYAGLFNCIFERKTA